MNMKNPFIIMLLITVVSCSNFNSTHNESPSTGWLRAINDELFQKICKKAQIKGNRYNDSIIVVTAQQLVNNTKTLIDEVNLTEYMSKDEVKKRLNIYTTMHPSLYVDLESKLDLINTDNIDPREMVRLLLVAELDVLNHLYGQIGINDIEFDNLDVYFIPDSYACNSELNGKLILAGSSKEVGNLVDFYFNKTKLEEVDGYGKVNYAKSMIDTGYINLKAKFPNWEINKKIQLE